MSLSSTVNNDQQSEATPIAAESTESEIDLEALARKIYELLKKEARIERERLG